MKHVVRFFMLAVLVIAAASCGNNKDAEKRIAELESRLNELENSNTTATGTPTKNTVEPEKKPEGPLPAFTFDEMEYDFGTIQQGDEVEHTFKFTNTGEAPLIIQSAVGSCGCTVPTYTNQPVAPGESGEMLVKFNSKGKSNLQNKTVTVTANTWPKKTTLRIKAMVETPEAVQ